MGGICNPNLTNHLQNLLGSLQSPFLITTRKGGKLGFLLSALLLIPFLYSGCPQSEPETKAENAALKVGIGAAPRDLDPHLVTGLPDFQVLLALFEGLVRAGPTDDHPVVPGVAEAWTLTEDGTRYRFQLRENASWSNGDPLLAEHFVFSMRRVLTPSLGSPHANWLYPIKNARAFHTGELSDFREVGIQAIGPRQLEIHLHRPTPYFLELLKHPAFYPVHPETIEKAGALKQSTTGWARPGSFVGNGPYLLTEWVQGSHIKVNVNPSYQGEALPQIPQIQFFPIDNANTEEMAFRTGELDITDDVPFNKRSMYRQRETSAYREYPVLATTYLVFNTRKPPLDDWRIRKALTLAIDRLSITENIVQTGTPATGFVPMGLPNYDPNLLIDYQVEEARRLLQEAGYPEGEGFPVLEYSLSNSDTSREVAEAIQNMWRVVLGIQVRLVSSEFRVYLDRLNRGEFSLGYLAWYGDFVDPYAFLSMMRETAPSNRSGWSNPQYESLLENSFYASNSTRRMELLNQAEVLLMKEVPLAPIYWVETSRLVNPDLKGWNPRLLDLHPYQYLHFEYSTPE